MSRRIKVSEVMSKDVVTVRPETPSRAIAALLSRQRISAVPVVDETGSPIGIVSEGDLMPRDEAEREQRRAWWLSALAEGEDLSARYLAEIEQHDRTAREIMSAPLIAVPETAELGEVADLLWANRINRAPVLRDGRIVGIVSRADLIRAIAYPADFAETECPLDRSDASAEGLDTAPPHATVSPKPESDVFHDLVHRVIQEKVTPQEVEGVLPWEKRHHEVIELLVAKLTDASWTRMLRAARLAASRGEKEYLLLRFPSELCNDRGRAVNAPDPSWPETLRGLAAQIFMRWNTELRPMGLRLNARVISFSGGILGDVGLFLRWGDHPNFDPEIKKAVIGDGAELGKKQFQGSHFH
jgi:CBS domain-containing protein